MNDWDFVPLGDVLDVQNGFAFKSAFFSESTGVPLIRIRDLKSQSGTAVSYVGDFDPQYIVQPGDFLIGMDGEFRCHEWGGPQALLNQRVCKLNNFSDKLLPRFLYYGINKHLKEIEHRTSFTTVKHLSSKTIKSIVFPLPPLDEQWRIVAVLDEAFEGLERARMHEEENLQNARELTATVIDTEFSEIFASVDGRELQSLCTNRGITYGVIKLGDHVSDGVPCLRTSNVRPLKFDLDGLKRISPELSQEYNRTILEGGELLVSVRGTLGGVAVVPPSMSGWNISREVAMIAVDVKRIDPKYTAFFLTTSRAKAWLTDVVTGATYRGINLADLRKIVVPCPSPTEQQALVQRLSEVKNADGQLLEACNRKLVDLEDLRLSLLQRAFAGELK